MMDKKYQRLNIKSSNKLEIVLLIHNTNKDIIAFCLKDDII